MPNIDDRSADYSSLVSFEPNMFLPIHRWYDLAEGYSSEFVRLLISELPRWPKKCLDPFSGVGTTVLTCKTLGIDAVGFENNPFFRDVSDSKISFNVSWKDFRSAIATLKAAIEAGDPNPALPSLESKTFFKSSTDRDRWVFHDSAAKGLQRLKHACEIVASENPKLLPLFRCALGEILIDISNVARHGKALGYKANWKDRRIPQKEVFSRFFSVIERQLVDLKSTQESGVFGHGAKAEVKLGDALDLISQTEEDQFDAIITSPPYLNSRDYTDVYRLELWMLDYVEKFSQEREIRNRSLTSHVQKTFDERPTVTNPKVERFIRFLEKQDSLWNNRLPDMIVGYFSDMTAFLEGARRVLQDSGYCCINVSNSAYCGRQIEVDIILSEIAESLGFECEEIRIARMINPSGQQKGIGKIRESVIVLRNSK